MRAALLLGKLAHGVCDLVGHGEVPDLVLHVVAGLGGAHGVPGLAQAPRARGADGVDGPAVRLGQQERAQRPPGGVEAVGLVPQAQEHLLGDVLRLGRVVEDPPGQPVDGSAVAPVDLGQRHLAVAGDGGHQLGIADFVDRAASLDLFGPAPLGGCTGLPLGVARAAHGPPVLRIVGANAHDHRLLQVPGGTVGPRGHRLR